MLGFLHTILIEAGLKFPTEDCAAAPTGHAWLPPHHPHRGWPQVPDGGLRGCPDRPCLASSTPSSSRLASSSRRRTARLPRPAMLGFLHTILIEAGLKFPTEDCAAAPTGLLASLEAMPTAGWLQIMLTTCMMETG